ncbi:MAG: adenine nucleotide alpha hydrolase family protein [Nanoarchaeota archaeon]|nr:adenine nucleotide alpha hydrolase family protein [Nanoarchaeota archaeon]MBU1027762.1 adenine nucleotide alpha hydrolase family protein [Nanoarchaeota archaeon]
MNLKTQISNTIKKYKICNKHEKVLVALSGGKDSTVCAYMLHKLGYNLEGFHINLGLGAYSERCEKSTKELCTQLEIKLYVYDFTKKHGSSMCYLRTTIQSKKALKNCAICGVIKKYIINKEARILKADKIATGHHLDDEAQTFFLNILKGAPELSASTGPLTRNISDKKFIPRIKPLFFCFEEDIKNFAKQKKLPVVYEPCPCALDSYRLQVRNFFKTLSTKEKKNIINNFDKIKDKIKKQSGKMNYCKICGEPTRKKICKRCELIKN